MIRWLLTSALALFAAPGAGEKAPVPPTVPAPSGIPAGAPTDAELVARMRTLPDVRELAGSYEKVDELAAAFAAEKKTFVRTVVYRTVPRPCSTGAHRVPHVDVTIHDHRRPGAPSPLTIAERDVHEVELHGAAFTPEQRRFLAAALAKR